MRQALEYGLAILREPFNLIAGVNGDGHLGTVLAIILISVCLLPMVVYCLWPILIGRKPLLKCRECDSGMLAETGKEEKRWLRLRRREFECGLCGNRAWFSNLDRLLWRQVGIDACSRCGKAILRETGETKKAWGWPLLFLAEGECSHCGNREWHYRLNGTP